MNGTPEDAEVDAKSEDTKSEASTSTAMSDADWTAIEEGEIIMDEVSDAIDEVSKATEMGDNDNNDKDFDDKDFDGEGSDKDEDKTISEEGEKEEDPALQWI